MRFNNKDAQHRTTDNAMHAALSLHLFSIFPRQWCLKPAGKLTRFWFLFFYLYGLLLELSSELGCQRHCGGGMWRHRKRYPEIRQVMQLLFFIRSRLFLLFPLWPLPALAAAANYESQFQRLHVIFSFCVALSDTFTLSSHYPGFQSKIN